MDGLWNQSMIVIPKRSCKTTRLATYALWGEVLADRPFAFWPLDGEPHTSTVDDGDSGDEGDDE